MEQTLHDLSGILLRAIPSAFLLIVVHFYLKGMLFKPLQKVLKQREELTAGARKAADESLAAAERKKLAEETVAAKQNLVETSASLADSIANTILARRKS